MDDFKIVIIICWVWGKNTPIYQHISNTQTIWHCQQGLKSRSLLKKLTFHGTWLTRFHTWFILSSRNRLFSPNPSKNTGSVLQSWKGPERGWRICCIIHSVHIHIDSDSHRLEITIDWSWQLSSVHSVHSVMMVFSAQLAEGGDWCPPPLFYWIYPLHSSYVFPSTPSTARLARYSYLYSPISRISPSMMVEKNSWKNLCTACHERRLVLLHAGNVPPYQAAE